MSPSPPPGISRSTNTSLCTNYSTQEICELTDVTQSFSGNLRYPTRRRSCISSCPSSMRSSPSHAKNGFGFTQMGRAGGTTSTIAHYSDTSSMEELQSAIQGAIAHCKNSMMQSKSMVTSIEI
ncbi:hypothetical protein RD792_010056 [Penstemon davidsonii]|uniref:Uncharacterized protein n=1 Tax=Penstemon davidsonii TaxID=160366 RepID=A0ABR0D0V0_9LAMI|nr:hypothetical protein RD792_010056 [Penstemon davidsonii]